MPSRHAGRAGRCGILAILLVLSAWAWGHDPLVVAGELTTEEEQVTLTIEVRQWALLLVVGRQDTTFVDAEDLARARPELERYLRNRVTLQVDGAPWAWTGISVPAPSAPAGNLSDPLAMTLTGRLPPHAAHLELRLSAFGEGGAQVSVIDSIRIRGSRTVPQIANVRAGEPIVWQLLPGAAADSQPIAAPRLLDFIRLGFLHIVPEGLDHILFVLGLFLLAPRLRPLLTQVTAFTVAHSLTLGLAMAGVLVLSPRIVEPLIALSIAVVALENIVAGGRIRPWRWLVVFAFGLVHGLGFAGALRGMPLAPGQFVGPLIGFNLGVEAGQFTVIAAAAALTWWSFDRPWYRQRVVIPGSLLIAGIGLFWAVQRALGFGIEA